MRKPTGGFQWWKGLHVRRDAVGQRAARPEPAERAPAERAPADGVPAEAVTALAALISTQERLVRDLAAGTAAQQTAMRGLFHWVGLYEETGRDRLPTPPDVPAAGAGSAEMPADLEARLLGPFEVRYRGESLEPWPSQRAASLLKFLLLHHGHPVRREVLMDTFWPASSAKSARNNLNVTVYQLRGQFRTYDPDRTQIVYRAGSYGIDPAISCRIDVDDYSRSVARAHRAADNGDPLAAVAYFREAISLYAGPLLEGDTSGDWYLERQRRLHLEHCAVLERLCGLLLERGDVGEAIAVGDELLEADPCRETGHQLLMRAYAALEQPQLIVQQFRRCEATMRRELAVDPAEATVELYRALLPGR